MRQIIAVVLGAILVGAPVSNVIAQGGWLDKGGDFLRGLGGGSKSSGVLSNADIASGLVDALKVGTERVVSTLGKADGFNKSRDVHIPLPGTLAKVKSVLGPLGMGSMADDLELRLNRAAEAATPRAKRLFWDAITQITLDDVQKIYNGPKDAATQYFRGKMSSSLAKDMQPIVSDELGRVGAIQTYDRMMGQYRALPFVPDVRANLTEYVLEKAIDAIFLYLGREEAAIRDNPAKRTTAILQKVFGAR